MGCVASFQVSHEEVNCENDRPTSGPCGEGSQHALSTRAGCECIAHALQAVCELDPEVTVTSIDGISAYNSIS